MNGDLSHQLAALAIAARSLDTITSEGGAERLGAALRRCLTDDDDARSRALAGLAAMMTETAGAWERSAAGAADALDALASAGALRVAAGRLVGHFTSTADAGVIAAVRCSVAASALDNGFIRDGRELHRALEAARASVRGPARAYMPAAVDAVEVDRSVSPNVVTFHTDGDTVTACAGPWAGGDA